MTAQQVLKVFQALPVPMEQQDHKALQDQPDLKELLEMSAQQVLKAFQG